MRAAGFLIAGLLLLAQGAAADVRILDYGRDGRPSGSRHLQGQEADDPAQRQRGAEQDVPSLLEQNEAEPRELILVNPPPGLAGGIALLGYRVLETVPLQGVGGTLMRLRVPVGMSERAALDQLRSRWPDLVADLNHRYAPQGEKHRGAMRRDRLANALIGWHDAPADCGRGLVLGSIDGAVDLTHPALESQRVEFRSFHDPKRAPGAVAHGTAVAAMLVGRAGPDGWGGLLPGADLKAANMFERLPDGKTVGNAMALVKAIDWIAGTGARVINFSVAGPDNKVMRYAIDRIERKGLVAVAAVGNWASQTRKGYPAAYESVIGATATGDGMALYDQANRGSYVDFAAPGVSIWTAAPGGGRMQSGTSFAAPYVTSVAAMQIAAGTAARPHALRQAMRRQTLDLGARGRDDAFGWGFLKARPICTATGS